MTEIETLLASTKEHSVRAAEYFEKVKGGIKINSVCMVQNAAEGAARAVEAAEFASLNGDFFAVRAAERLAYTALQIGAWFAVGDIIPDRKE